MSVITISRGAFSGGKTIAECVARKLDYRMVNGDVIVEKAAAHGVSQRELVNALQKPPSFLERFTNKKYLYLTLIQAALTDEVRTGRAVYFGNAGHLLLEGGGPVLKARVIAPLGMRVKMAQERLRLSEAEAIAYIQRRDDARRKWTQYVYGVDWSDANLYDVILNLEHIPLQAACETIASLARSQKCHDFGSECQEAMENLALASQVKLRLALDPATQYLEFVVTVSDGLATVRPKMAMPDLLVDVERVAAGTPGIMEVVLDEVVPLPQS